MNNQHESPSSLPTNKQLVFATLGALMVAAALLITVVLPAEYGIDKTGVGKMLGLTEMGLIKNGLAKEQSAQNSMLDINSETHDSIALPSAALLTAKPSTAIKQNTSGVAQISWAPKTASRTISLNPGQAAEIKVAMSEGKTVSYKWHVDQGHLNFDVHGDKPGLKYFNYTKGKKTTHDSGKLTAAFDGKHGWFWRNRSGKQVTVTLEIEGEFTEVIRVL